MNKHTHVGIAYIACRLISGKRITSLYDIAGRQEIDVTGVLGSGIIKEFDEKHKNYIPGYASGCLYEYSASIGHSIEIFIDERNFILHIKGSSAYYIGNVQGDTVCFYDHRDSNHFKYKITGCIEDVVKIF